MSKLINEIEVFNTSYENNYIDKIIAPLAVKKEMKKEANTMTVILITKFSIPCFDNRLVHCFSPDGIAQNNNDAIKEWVLERLESGENDPESILLKFKHLLAEYFPREDISEY